MTEISDRFRTLAEHFTAKVEAVPAGDPRWKNPSPCDEWDAAGVVEHVVGTYSMFFGMIDQELASGPDAAADPQGAWSAARDAMQTALDDPALAQKTHQGMFGEQRWEDSVARFIVPDLLLHGWDLARALGVDDSLDPDEVHAVFETAKGYPAEMTRSSGVFGPEVEIDEGAPEQDRLLAFTGRDPR